MDGGHGRTDDGDHDKPSNPSNVSGPGLGFTAGEPSTFQCGLDGGGFEACSSPKSYGGLADGSHTFVVKATDAAGNTGVPRQLHVDDRHGRTNGDDHDQAD